MQSILTDPDIGRDEGYKTYTELKFYNLLASLGDVNSKAIMESHSTILVGRERLNEAIENIDGGIGSKIQTIT